MRYIRIYTAAGLFHFYRRSSSPPVQLSRNQVGLFAVGTRLSSLAPLFFYSLILFLKIFTEGRTIKSGLENWQRGRNRRKEMKKKLRVAHLDVSQSFSYTGTSNDRILNDGVT